MKKLLLILPILGSVIPNLGMAAGIAVFSAGNISVTLHDTDCKLKEQVINLPKRAVWIQDGKETEGCFGFSREFGIVNLWFEDKTSTSIPAQYFEKVKET
jgi:hypothetical protein